MNVAIGSTCCAGLYPVDDNLILVLLYTELKNCILKQFSIDFLLNFELFFRFGTRKISFYI